MDKKIYFYGGLIKDSNEAIRKEMSTWIDVFDPIKETWSKLPTKGDYPPYVCNYARAVVGTSFYIYGGYDVGLDHGSLYTFDTTTATWSLVCDHDPKKGPLKKTGCRMAAFGHKLFLFAGYAKMPEETEQRKNFSEDTREELRPFFKAATGFTNEMHFFDLNEGINRY